MPDILLVGAGAVLTAVVVAANGAMPVSMQAAVRTRASVDAIALGEDPGHVLADTSTRLRMLGDVLPIALPMRP